ncbi:GH1 family beta-glucosidase [Bradyrhizobium sp. UFLA05-153]
MSDKVSRRQFAKIAGLSAAGMAAPGQSVEAKPDAGPRSSRGFPPGFLWGTATSSYQVEGAVTEDGRGPSIWDIFTRVAGKIEDGTNGDRANEHFHRYKDDIALIKELGCKAYRFSIAWPRVFPDGDGKPNPKGLDFYNRLIDELLTNGIEPWLTLYHWDLPQSLQDRFGGWRSAETCKVFGDYAAYVARHLTDRVKNVFTLNESGRFVYFGYGIGIDAPGLTLSQAEVNQVRHNTALAHGLAVQAVRSSGRRGTRIGPAENIDACIPAIDTPENVRATEIALRELNASYLNVIMEGRYTDAFLKFAGANAPKYTDAELKIISSPIDFLGLNIYAPQHYVVASDKGAGFSLLPIPKSFPHMNSDWLRVGPETIYWVPKLAAKIWKTGAIYISENGASGDDQVTPDGKIFDTDRIMYLRNYLAQLERATAEGVPVKGYFLWSLMDNFEWVYGLNKRFGLYHVNFDTQVRTPKLSASFYRNVIAKNAAGV